MYGYEGCYLYLINFIAALIGDSAPWGIWLLESVFLRRPTYFLESVQRLLSLLCFGAEAVKEYG